MDVTPARDALVTDSARSLIRLKARQLSRKVGFTESDREDLEQDLLLRLLEKAHLFAPNRGTASTLADRVVNSHVREIMRNRKRQKRAPGFTAQSLDATTESPGGNAVSQTESLTIGDLMRRVGSIPTDHQEHVETAEALDHALANMPDELRDFCRGLKTSTEGGIARELGISRRQVRNLINRVREHFEQAGLGIS